MLICLKHFAFGTQGDIVVSIMHPSILEANLQPLSCYLNRLEAIKIFEDLQHTTKRMVTEL